MNKKKSFIFLIVGIVLLISASLFYTYAIDVKMDETNSGDVDLAFNIDLANPTSRSVTVAAGKTKIFDIFVTNNNGGNIRYDMAYSPTLASGVRVAILNTSIDNVNGLIEDGGKKQITLVIENKSSNSVTYELRPIAGFENGGNITAPSGYTLITDIYAFKMPLDNSGANIPKLTNELIPVVYDNIQNSWVKADMYNPNGEYKWYDYTEKKWANAVLVTDTNRDTYFYAQPGTVVPEEDVVAYYVWIPRYKYKVWNINKERSVDSYDAYHTGIDIVFERGTGSTGTINCSNYSFATPTNVVGQSNETCSGSSGDYYTHPAFTFGDDELEGIWVGKFETTGSDDSITIKPNLTSLFNLQVTSFANAIYNLLPHDGIKNSHMMKNMEWGAVAYLTNSDYGMCSSGVCNKVGVNNYLGTYNLCMTGCGASAGSATSSTCSPYNTSSGMLASTTGNIYGVYDMSGGLREVLMGKASSEEGTFVLSTGSTYGELINNEDKYYDKYANSDYYNGQEARNRARLGDATGEVYIRVETEDLSWYGGMSNFPTNTYQWITRGDYIRDSKPSIFNYEATNWANYGDIGTRAVLAVY